jgi:hypothetical protein
MKTFLTFIIRLISMLDYVYRRMTRLFFKPSYVRQGRCLQCGQCCKEILIEAEPRYLRKRWLRNFFIWWNSYFNHLNLIGVFIEEGFMVFNCRKQLPSGKCGNYFFRPWFCREYPRGFKYFEMPCTLPGCGYKFISLQK